MKANQLLPMMLGLGAASLPSNQVKQTSSSIYTGKMHRPAHHDRDERVDRRKTKKGAKHRRNPAGTKLYRLAAENRVGLAYKRSA